MEGMGERREGEETDREILVLLVLGGIHEPKASSLPAASSSTPVECHREDASKRWQAGAGRGDEGVRRNGEDGVVRGGGREAGGRRGRRAR